MERRQEELGIHILENIRNELYYYFPYLDGALPAFPGRAQSRPELLEQMELFCFFPGISSEALCKKPEAVRRGYLHMLLHCLYLHLFRRIRRTDAYGTWPVILRWNRSFPGKDPDSGDRRRCEKNP